MIGRHTTANSLAPFQTHLAPDDNTQTRAYSRSYRYDPLGNLQEVIHTANGTSKYKNFAYITGTNHLEKIENNAGTILTQWNYGSKGQQTQRGTDDFYYWDAADQLIGYKKDDGSTVSKQALYLYDGAGNRVKKYVKNSAGKATVTLYIDDVFEHIYRKDSTGTLEAEKNIIYIKDGRSQLARQRIDGSPGFTEPAEEQPVIYILEDHLGSSSTTLSATGAHLNTQEYYPFGQTSFGSYAKKRYQYVGKELDEESGLYYYGMRYYEAWSSRFISVDPLFADYPFYTPYQYAGNKPINAIDLDGAEEAMVTVHGGNSNSLITEATYKSKLTYMLVTEGEFAVTHNINADAYSSWWKNQSGSYYYSYNLPGPDQESLPIEGKTQRWLDRYFEETLGDRKTRKLKKRLNGRNVYRITVNYDYSIINESGTDIQDALSFQQSQGAAGGVIAQAKSGYIGKDLLELEHGPFDENSDKDKYADISQSIKSIKGKFSGTDLAKDFLRLFSQALNSFNDNTEYSANTGGIGNNWGVNNFILLPGNITYKLTPITDVARFHLSAVESIVHETGHNLSKAHTHDQPGYSVHDSGLSSNKSANLRVTPKNRTSIINDKVNRSNTTVHSSKK